MTKNKQIFQGLCVSLMHYLRLFIPLISLKQKCQSFQNLEEIDLENHTDIAIL